MNSDYIKACLAANFRFIKRCAIMATEVGYFNSDFLVIRDNKLVEVEIKLTKSDLLADFRKDKHAIFENKVEPNKRQKDFIPNFFYFCVPPELVEVAVSKCIGKKYGVLKVLDRGRYCDRIRVIKQASKLHENNVTEQVKTKIFSRLSSEMANLRIDLAKERK